MLVCEIAEKAKLSTKNLEKMDLAEMLYDERNFKIIIDGKLFFHEPLFPILEFVQYCRQWNKKANTSFVYNTVESEENPLLSFVPQKDTWKIYSVWQKFECKTEFGFAEVYAFVENIINQVLNP